MSDLNEPSDASAIAYTSKVTSTIGRPPRKIYFIVQLVAFALTIGVCLLSVHMETTYRQLPLKDLPINSDWLFTLGKFFSKPLGIAIAAFIVVGLGLLALKGVIDGFLKVLIWVNVLWILVFIAVHTMGIWMPLLRGSPAAGK
jgi:tellurite resistance protein TehA-like permease